MNKSLEETQAELDAYIQKTQLLEPLVAEDEILRRDIAQSIAELSKVRLERDMAKDSMNELINEHQQALEVMRKEQEINFAALETAHKDSMDRLVRETAQAQEALTAKFHEDLALALQSVAPAPAPAPAEPEPVVAPVPVVDTSALEKELTLLQETVEKQTKQNQDMQDKVEKQSKQNQDMQEIVEKQSKQNQELQQTVQKQSKQNQELQETVEKQTKQIQELQEEHTTVSLALTEAKSEIVRTTKELNEVQERASREDLTTLTPTLASSAALSHHQNGHAASETSTTTTTTTISEGNVSKYEFTWAQFMFPAKDGQHHLKQVASCPTFCFTRRHVLVCC